VNPFPVIDTRVLPACGPYDGSSLPTTAPSALVLWANAVSACERPAPACWIPKNAAVSVVIKPVTVPVIATMSDDAWFPYSIKVMTKTRSAMSNAATMSQNSVNNTERLQSFVVVFYLWHLLPLPYYETDEEGKKE
jgi:hypothetical protein